jgi:hypothetical protein
MYEFYKIVDLCFYILHNEDFNENDYTSDDYLRAYRFIDILNHEKPFTKKMIREKLNYCIQKHRFLLNREKF